MEFKSLNDSHLGEFLQKPSSILEEITLSNILYDKNAPVAMLYSDSTDRDYALKVRLGHIGMRVVTARTPDSLVVLSKRNRTRVVLIRSVASSKDIATLLKKLTTLGMDFSTYPTFLLVRGRILRSLTPLLEIGIQDIIDYENGIETLMEQIDEICATPAGSGATAEDASHSQAGTRGNLTDMSIIDLIQALGPSQRTTRITVTPDEPTENSLTIFLNKGVITHAKLGDLEAEEAIYHALTWNSGKWLMESLEEADVPQTNIKLPNEYILMEGCRLIDEASRG
jgi:hypothetical protein